ncbi:MAG TPA: helix-turn-helix domain-containing protein [Ramlibacter sp.]|jgi:DNA-binding MarR family transcriptional regulator
MNDSALDLYLRRELRQAAAVSVLDEALSTHHGLCWADFVLLKQLADRAEGLPEPDLARRLGLSRSRLFVRTRPLEKLGWVTRSEQPRRLSIRPAASSWLSQAAETAARVCERLAHEHDVRGAVPA